ncbi:MAG: hypothetical protein [Bacteriophage sp.]|nr:MAG: hypothetical protein [Bacteriophage sp.]
MIKHNVSINFYINYKTGEICSDPSAKYDNEYFDDRDISEYWDRADYIKDSNDPTKSVNRKRFWSHKVVKVENFTNKGELSVSYKKELSSDEFEFCKKIAEKRLSDYLSKKEDEQEDTARAIVLRNIINASADKLETDDFSTLAVIKVKTSHSKWYANASVVNAPSTYLTVVPVEVAQQAKELQSIRQKHEGSDTFDFNKTDYQKRVFRVADHANDGGESYIDSSLENWEDIFNCDYL